MLFVSGASGQIGQLVTTELAKMVDPKKVLLGTRNHDLVKTRAEDGFRIVNFDFNNEHAMSTALDGVKRFLLISGNAPAEERIVQHRKAISAAKTAKVGHVVYVSFTNPSKHSAFPFSHVNAQTEKDLQESGLDFTILRNNQYMENLDGAIMHAKSTGILSLPAAMGKVAYVTRADAAAAAAAALAKTEVKGKTYEITGSAAWNLTEIARVLESKWDKAISVAQMPDPVFVDILTGHGLPPFVTEALLGLQKAVDLGELEAVSTDVETITGHAPQTLEFFLKRFAIA